MAYVNNLTINQQTGSTQYYATWSFLEPISTETNTTALQVGTIVKIKTGSTWYNGIAINTTDYPHAFTKNWKISEIYGNEATLGQSEDGSETLNNRINVENLTIISGGGGSSPSPTIDVSTLDHYNVKWAYGTGDGIYFSGEESETTSTNALYSAPDNTTSVRVIVTPVSKTFKQNDVETNYWLGTPSYAYHSTQADTPEPPSAPEVEINGLEMTLTIGLESSPILDPKTNVIQFEVIDHAKGNKVVLRKKVRVENALASYKTTIKTGGEYRARARAINNFERTQIYSQWSQWEPQDGWLTTIPAQVKNVYVKDSDMESVTLAWDAVSGLNPTDQSENSDYYEIEYTIKKQNFDTTDQTEIVSNILVNTGYTIALGSGSEYFFRVRAVNAQGNGPWSKIINASIGKKPAPPTTWTPFTSVTTEKDTVMLYWSHNSLDSSSQMAAKVSIKIGNQETVVHRIPTWEENPEEKTSKYELDISNLSNGATIRWKVQTKGALTYHEYPNPPTSTNGYWSDEGWSDWSVERTINVYSQPNVTLALYDEDPRATQSAEELIEVSGSYIVTQFPFFAYASTTYGSNQNPIGYSYSVIAKYSYETVDNAGNRTIVRKGDVIYNKYYTSKNDDFTCVFSAANIMLESGTDYIVHCTVHMDSGLQASDEVEMHINWEETLPQPDAKISIDYDSVSAQITPYCCEVNSKSLIPNVYMSVYRINYDGELVEISAETKNSRHTTVTDPHPSLNYARYRIVAVSRDTGARSFYDMPPYPVLDHNIIIQWDETWENYDEIGENVLADANWEGSIIKLPYNIETIETDQHDVDFVNYIGRENPVSYHGTNRGVTSKWSCDIPKNDTETINKLRRLSNWMGTVYIREPKGVGYNAVVSVQMNLKYLQTVIPVEIGITKVEGGI